MHSAVALCVATVFLGCLDKQKPVSGQASQATASQPEDKAMDKAAKKGQLVTVEGALQYLIQEEGKGEKQAKAGKKVVVHYTGWLANIDEQGEAQPDLTKKFDSSRDRNMPFDFLLGAGHVIRGWDLGVEGMKVGEQRRLVIPSNYGYGARGAGGVIPPNAMLIFDVELVDVK